MRHYERTKTLAELQTLTTPALKELASLMDLKDSIEKEALGLIIEVLKGRRVNTDKLELGQENIYADTSDVE